MSGVGKGVATSSLGLILKTKGYKVNLVKADPYLNVDAGTMNPTEHGEVFVMKNGLETDQDMGNYERFLHQDISQINYMTSGMVYKSVIDKERALGYGGKCVEAIPHVRDEIINRYKAAAKDSDITIVEIGGTIGDFQNAMFMEAAKTMKLKNPKDVMVIVVSYMPTPGTLGEMKSKPTQSASSAPQKFDASLFEVSPTSKKKENTASSGEGSFTGAGYDLELPNKAAEDAKIAKINS